MTANPRKKRDVNSEGDFLERYMALSKDIRSRIGHTFDKEGSAFLYNGFFVKCTFKEEDCLNETLWYQTNTPDFGNCYSFNVAFNPEDDLARVSSLTGAQNGATIFSSCALMYVLGLSLELYVDQTAYMLGTLSPKAGVRLVVNDRGTHPQIGTQTCQL